MLVIFSAKYGKNPPRTGAVTERTCGTDRQTDERTDGVKPIYPPVAWGWGWGGGWVGWGYNDNDEDGDDDNDDDDANDEIWRTLEG